MDVIYLSIAGINISFTCELPDFAGKLRARYEFFTGNKVRKSWAGHLNIVGRDFFDGVPERSFVEFHEPDGFVINGAHFSAKGDARRRTVEVFLQNSIVSFDGFLRVFVSMALFEKNGFLVHSAAICRDGHGYLLPGKSESGKTTLYRKLGNRYTIADELTAVYSNKGRYWLASTPFWGNFRKGSVNRACPLDAILFLDKNRAKPGIVPVTVSDSIEGLMKVVLCYANDAGHAKKLLSYIIAAATGVGSYQFKFNPDDGGNRIISYFLRRL